MGASCHLLWLDFTHMEIWNRTTDIYIFSILMKRSITQIILYFLIPFGGLMGISEYCLRQVPNDYKYKNDWLCANAKKVEIYVLGSSHTYYGIESSRFRLSAFNGAHVSQGLKYDLFLLQKFEQSMDSLKWVILPISYFTITSKGLEYGEEKWRIKNYTISVCYTHLTLPTISSV